MISHRCTYCNRLARTLYKGGSLDQILCLDCINALCKPLTFWDLLTRAICTQEELDKAVELREYYLCKKRETREERSGKRGSRSGGSSSSSSSKAAGGTTKGKKKPLTKGGKRG